jgi:MFS superfamily sulfate permease-like transporter
MKSKISIPLNGLAGLRQNWSQDAISGFIVFLLALPLSLGIAKASEFPPLMGLVSAIIGGIVVSFFAGSPLTIKGPAAGLIVIVLEGVDSFGDGDMGWKLTLGAIVVAGFVQVLFGVFKWGKLVDFFPLSAVHGMLAAIGLIIILKQIPVLLDIDPALSRGKSPFSLLLMIPSFFQHLDLRATLIGVVSFLIMMNWSKVPIVWLKKIPAALVVLLIAIPAELIMDFQHTEPAYALVHIGNLVENIRWNADFSGIYQTGKFVQLVIMIALVGSLESLLTVKAIDVMDPFKRKSNPNKDLIAIGIGNMFAGILGGLPMISEVARSSANVSNGAKTKWANFFHGIFILVFVVFAVHLIEMIPNTALAAMLISVGIKLAHPREFVQIFRIGKEQLAVFLITIFFTLYEDLLVGMAAGIAMELLLHLFHGTPLRSLFKPLIEVSFTDKMYMLKVEHSAIFTNYIGLKSKLDAVPAGMDLTIDFTDTNFVDHSVLENLHYFEHDYINTGGKFQIIGMNDHKKLSNHEYAARKKDKSLVHSIK